MTVLVRFIRSISSILVLSRSDIAWKVLSGLDVGSLIEDSKSCCDTVLERDRTSEIGATADGCTASREEALSSVMLSDG